ncbi:MAG: hypothetical protein M3463_16340 [Verrucomicrobiota bacterium]|nr:hypothetical protein [Verrucomicrobiota bacterium]
MYLIQILLPLYDNEQHALPREHYVDVTSELTERFGGLTAYTRTPAEGHWKDPRERTSRDEIVIYEVMTPELDGGWWLSYRNQLETRFRQEVVVIRAQEVRIL